MEWKEHVAWLVPISITMAAAVFIRHGRNLTRHPQLRNAVLCFVLVSFVAAGIAGFFGAMLEQVCAGAGRADDSTDSRREAMNAQGRPFRSRAGFSEWRRRGGSCLQPASVRLMVAIFAILADKVASFKSLMIFYKPTGPLSGVTTCAILVWLICWAILHRRWSGRMVALGGITKAALILLGLSLLLTFPPIADLF